MAVMYIFSAGIGTDDREAFESFASGGVGLAFVVFPTAIALMPEVPPFFSFLFFLMLLTLGYVHVNLVIVQIFIFSSLFTVGWIPCLASSKMS